MPSPERFTASEAHVIVDGVVVMRISVTPLEHSNLEAAYDASMRGALDSVWNAWASCQVWDFEAQRNWGDRATRGLREQLARKDFPCG